MELPPLTMNFALYRLPDDKVAKLCASSRLLKLEDDGVENGFVVAPFLNDRQWLIPADIQKEEIIAYKEISKGKCDFHPSPDIEYLQKVGELIDRLQRRGGKTVFSHIFEKNTLKTPIEIFETLCNAYPRAFVYMVHMASDDDIWIGATPELLLNCEGLTLRTMALAGTRPVGTSGEWDAKNREEQAMVTQFITDALSEINASELKCKRSTLSAGPVEHICTDISAKLPQNFSLTLLLEKLAPTPAVAGLPRVEALTEIRELESHQRDFYGGYCGPVLSSVNQLQLRLFVMLRLMRYTPAGKCYLYAGGGITPRSIPGEEWTEICNKTTTLSLLI